MDPRRNPAHFTAPDVNAVSLLMRRAIATVAPTTTVRMIDEARYQTVLNYAESYAGGILATVIKFTEGDVIVDPLAMAHLIGSQNIGRKNLAYHFVRWNKNGKSQLYHFIVETESLRQYQGDAKYAMDCESLDGTSESQRIDVGGEFVYWFDKEIGQEHLGVYSSTYWWQQQFPSGMPTFADKLWKWPAHWTPAPSPTLPANWKKEDVRIWQNGIWNDYSWCPPVPGYKPDVDTDLAYFSDETALVNWILSTSTPPPPIPPDPTIPELPLAQVIASDGLNVRKFPYYGAPILGSMSAGDIVEVSSIVADGTNEWWGIETNANLRGWAAYKYNGKVYMRWV